MRIIIAISKVIALILFTAVMPVEAIHGVRCDPAFWVNISKGTIASTGNYTIFVHSSYPRNETAAKAYCNDIKHHMLVDGQNDRADQLECLRANETGWDGGTMLKITNEYGSCSSWVGKFLQAAFPEDVKHVNVCGRSFPENVTTTCQLFNVDANANLNTTITLVSISAPYDSALVGRARAQILNEVPNDMQALAATDMIKFDERSDRMNMHLTTLHVTNVTAHQEMLGRAWPGLRFDCATLDTKANSTRRTRVKRGHD